MTLNQPCDIGTMRPFPKNVGEKFRTYWKVPSVAAAMRDILKAWDIWAVFAIAVVAVILAVAFDQSPLLVFTLVALALCATSQSAIQITTDGRAEFRIDQKRSQTDRDLGPVTKLGSVGSGRPVTACG
jgi:hypothetical protein